MDLFRPGRPPEFPEIPEPAPTPAAFDPFDDLTVKAIAAPDDWLGDDVPGIESGPVHPDPLDDPLERPDITAPPGRGQTELPGHKLGRQPLLDSTEASVLTGPEPPFSEHLEPIGRSAEDWAVIARSVFDRVLGMPGDWQHRDIAGPLTGEELCAQLRRSLEPTDRVDAYRFSTDDGREFTVVLPGQHRPTDRIFQRVGIRLVTEATKASVDAVIGVPVLTLLSAPTDLAGSFFYAAGLAELEELLKHPRPS
ncbi:hypothetical protein O7627_22240 [Solwaraspora sp. WMMD1047]|uniref:hypothetical protein n=1 Tax=Solwaraspora sp. WMMD1047 TaxID=3016102 RepID=UPI00241802CF|nr:hypothetical protein [Solwaraspora sp. WMMD1047]MDG4832005.1 hypothetical protein [Solwaraspora sp. WMMD1047]